MSVFDPETATLEELRTHADQQLSGKEEEPAITPAIEEEPVVEGEAEPEVLYRREIDLGDGSGVQVFEASSMEDLVDKLAAAQEHATRKIRQQAAELTAKKTTQTSTQVSDDEWALAQELATNPSLAFDKIFQKQLGSTPADIKKSLERLAQIDREASEEQAGKDFREKNPDYVATPRNGAKIEKYLKTYNMAGTVENIEKAFQDLSESGLLETKVPETQGTETQQTRIVNVTGHQRRAASGLTTRRSATVARAAGPTQEELESMPLEKLRELANKELSAQ